MAGFFLQSTEWEKFQRALGRKVWRAGDNLIIRHDLRGGFNYLYCPRPKQASNDWLSVIEGIARDEGSVFLKIDPQEEFLNSKFEFRNSGGLQPRKTVVLDLQRSEEKLLRGMHEKTRYNIRLSEKKGVAVGKGSIEDFLGMLKETTERDGFFAHSREHYEKLLGVRSENFFNELFFAKRDGEVLATAIINFYKPDGMATYLHGASRREHKEVMAPHLLHWCIIKEAKRRGFAFYDFWGIDEKRWPGLTRFKMGFGGKVVEYPRSVDIVYRPMWYHIYKFSRSIRRAM